MFKCESCKETIDRYNQLSINDYRVKLCDLCYKIRKTIWPTEYLCFDKTDDNYDKYCGENLLEKMNDMKKLFSDKYYLKITYKISAFEHSGYCSDNDARYIKKNEKNEYILPSNFYKNENIITLKKPLLKSISIKNYDEINAHMIVENDYHLYVGDAFDIFYSIQQDSGHEVCGCPRMFNITKLKIKPIIIL
jgi:hypothetical protein